MITSVTWTHVQWSTSKWPLRPEADWDRYKMIRISHKNTYMYTHTLLKIQPVTFQWYQLYLFLLLWKNYHKLSSVKRYEFIFSQFLWISRLSSRTNLGPWLRISIDLHTAIKVSAGLFFLLDLCLSCANWRKMHNLNVENHVLFSGLTEDSSPGCSLSDSSQ